jgi:hypothetical protein
MKSNAELQAFRRMDPAQKLSLIGSMHVQARKWKLSALQKQHPDWTEEQLKAKVRELFLYGSD